MRHVKEATIVGLIGLGCIFAALTNGCGGRYEVDVPPVHVEVDVIHHISTTEFMSVFAAQCRRELGPDATYDQINNCAADKLASFMDDLAASLKGGA